MRRIISIRRLALLAVTASATLNVILFLQRQSLWLDEAAVALNIGRRSFAALATPLGWRQLAPVPWLWLEKLAVSLGGMHELALRAPALMAGIALPWLVWSAGRRLVGEPAALTATVLTAASGTLRFYANETKPYALDTAIAALLLLLAARIADRGGDRRSWRMLGIVGVVAILLSFPAVLVLAGIGIAFGIDALALRDWPGMRRAAGWGIAWIAAFGVPQVLLYRRAVAASPLTEFWRPDMAQLGRAGLVTRASHAANEGVVTLIATTIPQAPEIFAVLLAIGVWAVWRRAGTRSVLILIGPFCITVLAWVLGQMPAQRRLLLFLAPMLALLLGAALTGMIDWLQPRRRPVGAALATLLVLALAASEIVIGVTTPKPSGGRDLAAAMLAGRPGPIWLTNVTGPTWLFYSTDWSHPDTARLDWFAAAFTSASLARPGIANLTTGRNGDPFVYERGPHGLEMLATLSGLRIDAAGPAMARPAPDWARREAARIAAVAHPGAWVMMTHDRDPEREALVAAMRDAPMSVEMIHRERRGTLWWVTPPGTASAGR